MKKFISVICSLVLTLTLAFCFTACDDAGTTDLTVSNENVSYEYTASLGWYVTITGTITNTTKRDFSYISVTYKIYDASGAVIGTALDNANNIGSGETWRFEANSFSWFDEKPASVKFSEIQKF